jgi:hypothetical protein
MAEQKLIKEDQEGQKEEIGSMGQSLFGGSQQSGRICAFGNNRRQQNLSSDSLLGSMGSSQGNVTSAFSPQTAQFFSSGTCFGDTQDTNFGYIESNNTSGTFNQAYSTTTRTLSQNAQHLVNQQPAGITRENITPSKRIPRDSHSISKPQQRSQTVSYNPWRSQRLQSMMHQFLIQAINPKPYPFSSCPRDYDLNITLETETDKADTLFIINSRDHFHLSSAILKEKTNFLSDEEPGRSEFLLSFPFDSKYYDVLFYLTYNSSSRLSDKVNYLHDILELYIVLTALKVKNKQFIIESMLNKPLKQLLDVMVYTLPDLWSTYHLDFDFVIFLIHHSVLTTSYSFYSPYMVRGSNYIQPCYNDILILVLFIWLGYDKVQDQNQLYRLAESQEYVQVKEYLEIKRIEPSVPHFYYSRMPRALDLLEIYYPE